MMTDDYAPALPVTELAIGGGFLLLLALVLYLNRAALAKLRHRFFVWRGEPSQRLRRAVAQLFWPLGVSLLVTLAFVASAQTHEVLGKMAENLREQAQITDVNSVLTLFIGSQNAFSMMLLVLFGAGLYMNAAWLVALRDPQGKLAAIHGRLVPIIAILPFLGVFAGSLIAAFGNGGQGDFAALIALPGLMVAVGGIVGFYLFGRLPDILARDNPMPQTALENLCQFLRNAPVIGGFIQLATVAPLLGSDDGRATFRAFTLAAVPMTFAAFYLSPVAMPQAIGPAGVVFLFGIGLSALFTVLAWLSDLWRLPLIPLVFGWAVLLSLFDWTDNHVLEQRALPAAALAATPAAAFAEWSAPLRNGQDRFVGPVYLVAAQGGGLYAATHTALFLARLQDMPPAGKAALPTPARIFAISGVSGGSVGTAIFEIVRQSGVCDPAVNPGAPPADCHSTIIQQIMRNDFLSPVLAGWLFTDVVARLVPNFGSGHWLPGREDALRKAFEAAIARALVDNGLSPAAADRAVRLPIADAALPGGVAGRPLILFNTTDVDSGQRVVITPLRAIDPVEPPHQRAVRSYVDALHCLPTAASCPAPGMLAAALVSARFAYVTPAASVHTAEGIKIRLVDGGYFENSGTETLHDLTNALGGGAGGAAFELVALDFEPLADAEQKRNYAATEILAPIRTMMATRGARGELPKRRSENRVAENWRHSAVRLDRRADEFTLGWFLSQRTLDEIACHIWDDRQCRRLGIERTPTMYHNRCVIAQLHLQGPTSNCN